MIFSLKSGLIDWAPSKKELIPRTTSGNWEGGDVAGDASLRHLGSNLSDHIATFVKARRIGRHIGRTFIAGGVFEFHLRKFLGDLDGRVHVAERGGKNQAGALAGQASDGALGVRTLGDFFDIYGFNFVTKFLFDG